MKQLLLRSGVRRERWLGIFAAALALGAVVRAQAGSPSRYDIADLKALQQAFADLTEKARPSVVAIRTYDRSEHAKLILIPSGQGSGLVIDADGHIATNRHVVEGAAAITVILNNGVSHDARIVQSDRRSDLAVLKIDAAELRPAAMGDASKLRVGHWVFACGNPFGLANDDGNTSATYGTVSALGRQMTRRLVGESELEYYGNMIETSATINPGNSGGPLFNLDGEVVGIVTAIETSSGVNEGHGFAIPIDRYTGYVLNTLKAGQAVRYGFLGVSVQDVTPVRSSLVTDQPSRRGAEVQGVSVPDGPAAQAGLQSKDVVLEYNGTTVENSDHLVRMVGFTPAGTRVSLVYSRNGVKKTAEVTLGDRFELLSAGGTARAAPPQ